MIACYLKFLLFINDKKKQNGHLQKFFVTS